MKCSYCEREANPCEDCGKPAAIHDHEYGEWWCKDCWDAFPAEEQGTNYYETEGQ